MPVKQSSIEKLNSFRFVKDSRRKRSIRDESAPLLKRKSDYDISKRGHHVPVDCGESAMDIETSTTARTHLSSSTLAISNESRSLTSLQTSFTTPTKPPTHRNSVASIIKTIRQTSNEHLESNTPNTPVPVSSISQQLPIHGNSTPSRKSISGYTPLNRQPLPGNSTSRRGQTTSLDRGARFSTPPNRQSTQFSTPLNRHSGVSGFSTPCNPSVHSREAGFSTPLSNQPASMDSRGDEFLTPLNARSQASRDGCTTPQPTPLICTPTSKMDSCGVDILRTPVTLAKRKFPGPAGLLPPLVSVCVCVFERK